MKTVKWLLPAILLLAIILLLLTGKSSNVKKVQKPSTLPAIMVAENGGFQKLEVKGEKTVISFWASYDAKSRMENIRIERICKAKKIRFISICLDKYASVYEETIRRDGLEEKDTYLIQKKSREQIIKNLDLENGFFSVLLDAQGRTIKKNPSL